MSNYKLSELPVSFEKLYDLLCHFRYRAEFQPQFALTCKNARGGHGKVYSCHYLAPLDFINPVIQERDPLSALVRMYEFLKSLELCHK